MSFGGYANLRLNQKNETCKHMFFSPITKDLSAIPSYNSVLKEKGNVPKFIKVFLFLKLKKAEKNQLLHGNKRSIIFWGNKDSKKYINSIAKFSETNIRNNNVKTIMIDNADHSFRSYHKVENQSDNDKLLQEV